MCECGILVTLGDALRIGAHLDANGIDDDDAGGDAEDVEAHANACDVGGRRREVVCKHRRVCMHSPVNQCRIMPKILEPAIFLLEIFLSAIGPSKWIHARNIGGSMLCSQRVARGVRWSHQQCQSEWRLTGRGAALAPQRRQRRLRGSSSGLPTTPAAHAQQLQRASMSIVPLTHVSTLSRPMQR